MLSPSFENFSIPGIDVAGVLKMEYFLLIYFNKLSVFLLKGKQTDDSSFCEKLQRLKPKLSREGKFMH